MFPTLVTWSGIYKYMQNDAGMSDQMIFVAISWAIVMANYLHAWFFVMADWYGFLDKYAIRSGKKRLPTLDMQWQAIKEASIDAIVVKPLILYFTFPYISGPFVSFGDVPSGYQMLRDWFLMSAYFSTSLYFIHGAMHCSTFLYKHVHKRHHSFHSTVGFAAQYAHPGEGLASSLHVVGAIMWVQPHFLTYCLFLSSTLVEIVDSHCGYDVPWAFLFPWAGCYPWGSGALVHDYHHSHNLGAYGGGLLGVWDKLLGTDADFRAFQSKEEHKKSK